MRSWRQTSTLTALRELLTLSAQVAPHLARRAELSHSELRALELLMVMPHGPADLARALGLTSAAASGIVDRLESRGHVTRTAHPTDGRRTSVELTASGREELISYLLPMFIALGELDAQLSDDEREVVDRYLRGATAAVRRVL